MITLWSVSCAVFDGFEQDYPSQRILTGLMFSSSCVQPCQSMDKVDKKYPDLPSHDALPSKDPVSAKISEARAADFDKVVDGCCDTLANVQKIIERLRRWRRGKALRRCGRWSKFSLNLSR
jgi:hypothetical protein